MNPFKADLHCHSIFSDGTNSVEELITLARSLELSALSITDHDSIKAYQNGFEDAKKYQFRLLPGVEFSTVFQGHSIHVLGYAFDLQNQRLQDFCSKHFLRRNERTRLMLERLHKLGLNLTFEDLEHVKGSVIGRPHIAFALLKKNYVSSMQEAFEKYLGEGKAAFVPGEGFTVEETLQIIHEAKGFAILAHPQLIIKASILRKLLELNFDGVEGYYARFKFNPESPWIKAAKKKDWLITGGSDYHGATKPLNTLGSSWANQETFTFLYEHYLKL